jgi:asparagine synthase (glutamine-hydrolysing)
MCGINGIFCSVRSGSSINREELLRTRDAMEARGPDSAGEWISSDDRVALAARRLAILDLSPTGDQPMRDPSRQVTIVCNGEIYNYRELRAELEAEGFSFRGHSDTEVVLTLYLKDGPAMLSRLRGMFGLAIVDERLGRDRRLLIARDPFGIKPLYYSHSSGAFRFASQLKALERSGEVGDAVDPAGLAGFLLWGSVPEPWTIRRDVRALPAGHFLLIDDDGLGDPTPFVPEFPTEEHGRTPTSSVNPTDAARIAIEDSVRAHLISDVPVALFLSAGLDSSLIAAVATRQRTEPLTTFTLSFDVLAGTAQDEAPLAAAVAAQLGTRHIERHLTQADFVGLWPRAIAAMDQPSIDGFNTYVVSALAHDEGIKVALSGLGGDELFGSYPNFREVPKLLRLARAARAIPGSRGAWPPLARTLFASKPKLQGVPRHGSSLPGSYFLRRGLFLPEELPGLIGRQAAAEGLASYDPVRDACRHMPPSRTDEWEAIHQLETSMYMRNQLLRDSDWASMASSVELRVPLVDAHLRAALAAQRFEPARSAGKAALVRQIAPELPASLWQRPKTGFYIPVIEWLRPDFHGRAGANMGARSRTLAELVLEEFGIPLQVGAT